MASVLSSDASTAASVPASEVTSVVLSSANTAGQPLIKRDADVTSDKKNAVERFIIIPPVFCFLYFVFRIFPKFSADILLLPKAARMSFNIPGGLFMKASGQKLTCLFCDGVDCVLCMCNIQLLNCFDSSKSFNLNIYAVKCA